MLVYRTIEADLACCRDRDAVRLMRRAAFSIGDVLGSPPGRVELWPTDLSANKSDDVLRHPGRPTRQKKPDERPTQYSAGQGLQQDEENAWG